jgi:DUF971 family protein
MQPDEIRVVDGGRQMRLIWSDGSVDALTARQLRCHGRDAPSERRRLDGLDSAPDGEVAILEVVPIGRYAVNLRFSDGYDRGIYPWTYLRKIAAGDAAAAFGH